VTGYEQFSYGLDIGGEVYEIPWGGPIALVLGYEHRDEEGFNRPSAVTVAGETGGNGIDATQGGYKLNEFFGEVRVPVLAELPFAEALTADAAFRYSKYDTFGSDTTYRVGLSYAPLKDVSVRGIYNTVFRAPTITDLYGGAADSYESLSDPCNDWDTTLDPASATYANCRDGNGIAAVPLGYNQSALGGTQFRTNIGGNPALDAEGGDVWSAGLVFTPTFLPKFLENFSLTVDYYNITMNDAIDNPEPQFLLDDCYSSVGLSDPTCAAITRDPASGLVSNLEAFTENLNKIETSGLDIAMEYELDLDQVNLDNIGIVDLSFYFNYLFDYTETDTEGRETDFTGTLISNSGIYAEVKWATRITFRRDDWSITNTARYLGKADILEFSGITDSVPSVTYWDIAAQYNLNGWTFTAGLDNVLDKDPPFFPEGGMNANAESYDFIGRFVWGRISYRF
jgi:iron complex outermembrane receptor protein